MIKSQRVRVTLSLERQLKAPDILIVGAKSELQQFYKGCELERLIRRYAEVFQGINGPWG